MNVRPARAADVDAVLRIEGAWATTPHWTRRQLESELSAPASVFIVAESSDGDILGYAVGRVYPPEFQLLNIAVAVARRGVGRSLMDALKQAAADCDKLTLEVSAANAGARAFYEALGLRVVGRRPKFYNDGSDAVLMDLVLR